MKIETTKTLEEVQLETRRVELQHNLMAVDGELSGLRLAADRPRVSANMAAALRLIDGADAMPNVDLERERDRLRKKRNALSLAIGEIDKLLKPLQSAREKGILQKEARPEYLPHVIRLMRAVDELCAASDAEKKFYAELQDAGFETVGSYLPRASFPGDWRDDPSGTVVYYWRRHIRDNFPEVLSGGHQENAKRG